LNRLIYIILVTLLIGSNLNAKLLLRDSDKPDTKPNPIPNQIPNQIPDTKSNPIPDQIPDIKPNTKSNELTEDSIIDKGVLDRSKKIWGKSDNNRSNDKNRSNSKLNRPLVDKDKLDRDISELEKKANSKLNQLPSSGSVIGKSSGTSISDLLRDENRIKELEVTNRYKLELEKLRDARKKVLEDEARELELRKVEAKKAIELKKIEKEKALKQLELEKERFDKEFKMQEESSKKRLKLIKELMAKKEKPIASNIKITALQFIGIGDKNEVKVSVKFLPAIEKRDLVTEQLLRQLQQEEEAYKRYKATAIRPGSKKDLENRTRSGLGKITDMANAGYNNLANLNIPNSEYSRNGINGNGINGNNFNNNQSDFNNKGGNMGSSDSNSREKTYYLQVGDVLEDWYVEDITNRLIILKNTKTDDIIREYF
jgi:hypothetical protein